MQLQFVAVCVFFGGWWLPLPAQEADEMAPPRVSLILPADLPSENVQIDYFMTGPFGGYGGFVRPETKRTSYEIQPSVEGRTAQELR